MTELTREAMKPLLELQRIDSATDRLRLRRADLPEQRELNELETQRGEVSTVYVERNGELDEASRRQSKLEGDIEMITAKMHHEDERRSSGAVSSPRELVNIQAELDALGRRKVHLEDEQLEVMEQREGLDKEVADLKASLDEFDRKIADATARRDAAIVEIDRELGELAAQRAQLVPTIHADAIELYEELRTRKDGVAVAALEKGTCRGCALPLSPVALDEIKHSDDPFIRCENCRRMLVIP
jgi:uncharacterized protein